MNFFYFCCDPQFGLLAGRNPFEVKTALLARRDHVIQGHLASQAASIVCLLLLWLLFLAGGYSGCSIAKVNGKCLFDCRVSIDEATSISSDGLVAWRLHVDSHSCRPSN